MFESGYYITAELEVKDPSKIQDAKKALLSLCTDTLLNEKGCTLFQLHQVSGDAGRFLLWERFENEEAFLEHFEKDYTNAYIEQAFTDIVRVYKTNIATSEE